MQKSKLYFLLTLVVTAITALDLVFVGFAVAASTSPKPYFQGKVITFIVAVSAGGGTDMWARLLSRHMSQYIPGKPTIVVRNMPEAQGIAGGNYAWRAKPDGLTATPTTPDTVVPNILRPRGTEHKLEEMIPIYCVPSASVITSRPNLIKEPKNIMTAKGLVFGHAAATTGTTIGFIWAKELLGFECKMVLGYAGSGPSRLAFLAGETNITGGSTIDYMGGYKSYADKGEVVPVFQTGMLDADGNVIREPGGPDVPTVKELYEQIYGKAPSGPTWEAVKLMVGSRTYGKTILLPQKTPAEIVSIYRKAVTEMLKDPKFLEESEMLSPKATHLTGDVLVKGYPKGVQGTPEVVNYIRKVLTEKYGVIFQ